MSPSSLRDLAERSEATTSPDFVRWHSPDGKSLPYPDYASIEGDWRAAMQALGAGGPSETYNRILRRELAPATLESVAAADRATLDGFTTHIIRADRFCDGAIAAAHERGLLAAVALRYADLLESA